MKKVLIIEDELSLQNIIAAYFRKNEFEVIVASDGLQGLEAFRANDIDIICSDIMMPNIDGWQVVKSVRQTSNVPIILMTALDSELDQLKGFDLNILLTDMEKKDFIKKAYIKKKNMDADFLEYGDCDGVLHNSFYCENKKDFIQVSIKTKKPLMYVCAFLLCKEYNLSMQETKRVLDKKI